MLYISPGNRRMNIPTFSLPSEDTCPGATDLCKKNCYAKKAERIWKYVLPSRKRNLNGTKNTSFIGNVIKYIDKHKPEYFRIHESGDFYNQKYLCCWFVIANLCPDTKFLAYTQNYKLDYSLKPDNFILYWTVWPDSLGVPETGLRATVIDDGSGKIDDSSLQSERLDKAFKCKKGKGNNITCEKCKYCLEGKGDVTFKIH